MSGVTRSYRVGSTGSPVSLDQLRELVKETEHLSGTTKVEATRVKLILGGGESRYADSITLQEDAS